MYFWTLSVYTVLHLPLLFITSVEGTKLGVYV